MGLTVRPTPINLLGVGHVVSLSPEQGMAEKSVSFSGSEAVNVYACRVLASGLRLYAKTGMQPNRRFTPTRMLDAASAQTGKSYKRGQYEQAAADLSALATEATARLTITETATSITFEG
jgi:hypothetical protein